MRISFTIFFIVILFSGGCSNKKDESLKKSYVNSIGMEFVLIPSGSFSLGADDNIESGYEYEKPKHNVVISKSFYIGKYEVTQEEWERVMGYNPSKFKGAKKPVEHISWYDAKIFLSKLNAMENNALYRLPTEAEWEYAARATPGSKYSFGNDEARLDSYAWYYLPSNDKVSNKTMQTNFVGEKKPNRWGLYDIHGNVWEWTEDWYDPQFYSKSSKKDPQNYVSSNRVAIRSGSWINSANFLRSAARNHQLAIYKGDDVGMRVVMEIRD
jgi:formylglycine-generating enzyme required for sulfatase activity